MYRTPSVNKGMKLFMLCANRTVSWQVVMNVLLRIVLLHFIQSK